MGRQPQFFGYQPIILSIFPKTCVEFKKNWRGVLAFLESISHPPIHQYTVSLGSGYYLASVDCKELFNLGLMSNYCSFPTKLSENGVRKKHCDSFSYVYFSSFLVKLYSHPAFVPASVLMLTLTLGMGLGPNCKHHCKRHSV